MKCKDGCEFSDWELDDCFGADILCPHCMHKIIKHSDFGDRFVLTSGGFDPLHSGQITSFLKSAELARNLIVVVNDDQFLIDKKGKAFMPQKVRCQIVSMLERVHYVVPAKPSRLHDATVNEILEIIKPDFFAKGGDRNIDNIPEKKLCQDLGIKIVQGMGDDKHWSSSKFLEGWGEYYVYNVYGKRYEQVLE